MTATLVMLACLCAGVVAGSLGLVPESELYSNLETYALYALLFFIGIGIGSDEESIEKILKMHPRILFVPLGIVVGSLVGGGLISVMFGDVSVKEGVAIGAGFGYYSLSSVLISQTSGPKLGLIALVANMTREIFTLVFAPWIARWMGRLSLVASGGATSMDITLPSVIKYHGNEVAILSVTSGVILTVLVPVIIPLFLG